MDPNAHILSEEDHPFGMESFFQSKRVPLQGACPIMCTLHVPEKTERTGLRHTVYTAM